MPSPVRYFAYYTKLSAIDAASAAGVTWTHAISNSGSDITSQYKVGQYIIFESKFPSKKFGK